MSQTQVSTTTKTDVISLINQSKSAFQMALGKPEIADHFMRTALTLVRQTPKLASCDGMTLLGALMMSAQLKLYPGMLGQSYIIPYWSGKRNCYEAQFQIGYQGLIDLFYRHSLAKELYAEPVHKNDRFKLKLGTDRYIDHEPAIDDRGEVIGYYAVAKLSTGAQNFCYMSVADAERWKKQYGKTDRSGAYGVWDSDFDAMALKTCIKRVLKLMPKSVEMIRIIEADEQIKRPINEIELKDVDILPNRAEIIADAPVEVQVVTHNDEPVQHNETCDDPVQHKQTELALDKSALTLTTEKAKAVEVIRSLQLNDEIAEHYFNQIAKSKSVNAIKDLLAQAKAEA